MERAVFLKAFTVQLRETRGTVTQNEDKSDGISLYLKPEFDVASQRNKRLAGLLCKVICISCGVS
jgi:hypothetical protein